MQCPECKRGRWRVIDTRIDGNTVFRERHCFVCGASAISTERPSVVGRRPHPPKLDVVFGVCDRAEAKQEELF